MARKRPDDLERFARRAAAGDLEAAERVVAILRERRRAEERQEDFRGPLRRWVVTGDVRAAFSYEVHARSAAEAEARILELSPRELGAQTSREPGEGVEIDGVHEEEESLEEDETADAYYCVRCGAFLENERLFCARCLAIESECDDGCLVHDEDCDRWCDHQVPMHLNACLGSDKVEEIKFERRRERR